MLLPVLKDLPFSARDEVCLLINSLGATPKEELYIIARKAIKIIESQDIAIFHTYVGEFATSMEMAGASISLCRLDAELKRLISVPACTPFLYRINCSKGQELIMNSLRLPDLKGLFGIILEEIINNKDQLIELDSKAGDGDLGITMAKAFTVAYESIKNSDFASIGDALTKAGMAILMSQSVIIFLNGGADVFLDSYAARPSPMRY